MIFLLKRETKIEHTPLLDRISTKHKAENSCICFNRINLRLLHRLGVNYPNFLTIFVICKRETDQLFYDIDTI